MKNRLLAVLTGAGLAFVVAGGCDPNPPRRITVGTGGATGSGGAIGSGGATSGSGGTTGSGGATTGSGGETAGTGGATSNGGETTGTAGASSGGSAQGGHTAGGGAGGRGAGSGGAGGHVGGSAGAGGASGGTFGGGGAAGPEDIIETFEDNDGRINMIGGRQGPWHSFADTGCSNEQPPTSGPFMPQMGGADSTMYAAHASGSGCGKFGGIGFELNNATTTPESMQSMAYSASAYRGISFWAKGNANLRVEFGTKAFIPTDKGGSCTSNCWNVYGSRKIQGMVSMSDWKQFTVLFSELEREDGSKTPAFDPSQLIGIAFKHEGASFDFWLDEIEFVK